MNLSIRLIKHSQDLYAENYKIIMKDIKEDLNKWRDIYGLEDSS